MAVVKYQSLRARRHMSVTMVIAGAAATTVTEETRRRLH